MPQGVVFLPSFYVTIREIPEDLRSEANEDIILYGLYGTEPEMSNVINPLFGLVRSSIDASLSRYRVAKGNRRVLGGDSDAAT